VTFGGIGGVTQNNIAHESSHLETNAAVWNPFLKASKVSEEETLRVLNGPLNKTNRESDILAYERTAAFAKSNNEKNLEYAGVQIMKNGNISRAEIERLVEKVTPNKDVNIIKKK
jgi:hypothetical protein